MEGSLAFLLRCLLVLTTSGSGHEKELEMYLEETYLEIFIGPWIHSKNQFSSLSAVLKLFQISRALRPFISRTQKCARTLSCEPEIHLLLRILFFVSTQRPVHTHCSECSNKNIAEYIITFMIKWSSILAVEIILKDIFVSRQPSSLLSFFFWLCLKEFWYLKRFLLFLGLFCLLTWSGRLRHRAWRLLRRESNGI